LSFFNFQKKQIFFVTKSFNEEMLKKSDIVLSPEFYWVKKITLNVKFSHEVKKMAPSLFEGSLPHNRFEYKVFKISTNNFILIAYDLKSILEELSSMKINMALVDKIYTIQSEFLKDDVSLKVNEDFGIITDESVVVYSPLRFLQTNDSVKNILKAKKLSSNYIYSQQFQKINISSKQLNIIILLLVLLNATVFIDIFKLQKDKKLFMDKKTSFIVSNHLPRTTFQIKSIQDELMHIDKSQKELRQSIGYIEKFRFLNSEFFKNLKFTKNKLVYDIKFETEQRENQFKTYLDKKINSYIFIEKNR